MRVYHRWCVGYVERSSLCVRRCASFLFWELEVVYGRWGANSFSRCVY